MPDAAARRHPPDLGREAEQRHQPEPVDEGPDAEAREQPPAEADVDRRERRVDSRLPLVRSNRSGDRHERDEEDGRKGSERHIPAAVDRDDVVRADRTLGQACRVVPGPAVKERVGEVEEVTMLGVEEAVRQPVDRHRRDGDHETDDRRTIEADGHVGVALSTAGLGGRPGGPSRSPTTTSATSVTQKAIGYAGAGVTPMRKTAVARGTRTAHHWRRSSR